jgi:hypothetical protein
LHLAVWTKKWLEQKFLSILSELHPDYVERRGLERDFDDRLSILSELHLAHRGRRGFRGHSLSILSELHQENRYVHSYGVELEGFQFFLSCIPSLHVGFDRAHSVFDLSILSELHPAIYIVVEHPEDENFQFFLSCIIYFSSFYACEDFKVFQFFLSCIATASLPTASSRSWSLSILSELHLCARRVSRS